jgi:hypothetical protein
MSHIKKTTQFALCGGDSSHSKPTQKVTESNMRHSLSGTRNKKGISLNLLESALSR